MNAPHHPNVERVLAGTDWHLLREGEAERVQKVYERVQREWNARNEGEANRQMQSFTPPFVKHEEIEERLTPGRVLIGLLVFLAVCDLIAMLVLNFWRPI